MKKRAEDFVQLHTQLRSQLRSVSSVPGPSGVLRAYQPLPSLKKRGTHRKQVQESDLDKEDAAALDAEVPSYHEKVLFEN